MRSCGNKQSARAVVVVVMALLCGAGRAAPPAKSDYEAPVRLPTLKATAKVQTVADLQRLADKGDAVASFELGTRYIDGDGVAADTGRAIVYFEKAAYAGSGKAAFRLGKMYHDGTDVPQDYERCVEFYSLAAKAGEMEAQHNIGAMLVSARGVKRDYVEGLAWLIVAKRAGNDPSVETQVRQHLAKYPAKIKEGENRAEELCKDLSHATVRAELVSAPVKKPTLVAPPVAEKRTPVQIEKPNLPLPSMTTPESFKLPGPEKP